MTSIAALGTGLLPGEHGLVGYSFAISEDTKLLNALTWNRHGEEVATVTNVAALLRRARR